MARVAPRDTEGFTGRRAVSAWVRILPVSRNQTNLSHEWVGKCGVDCMVDGSYLQGCGWVGSDPVGVTLMSAWHNPCACRRATAPPISCNERQNGVSTKHYAASSKQQVTSGRQKEASSKQRAASSKQQVASSGQWAVGSEQQAAGTGSRQQAEGS